MEALSFRAGLVRFARAVSILVIAFTGAAAFAHPALIPLPFSVNWHDGNVRLGADTIVQGDGNAASTASYLARELGLKQATGGASRIRLSLVPVSRIANPEGYHLRARRQ